MDNLTRKRISRASTLVFYIYIGLVLYFVFFSDHYGRTTGFTEFRYNMTPFAEIRRYITYRESFTWENLVTNLLGNICVFVPMGMLLPFVRRKRTGFFHVFFISILFSLFIETVQLITRVGVFDIDDVIMNTFGGLLGYVAFNIGRIWYKFRRGELFKRRKREIVGMQKIQKMQKQIIDSSQDNRKR